MNIQICVGSSCHLKGSEKFVELFQKAVEERGLADKITLAGSFCIEIIMGVTPATFESFFETEILPKLY